jgi:hypothetical protein
MLSVLVTQVVIEAFKLFMFFAEEGNNTSTYLKAFTEICESPEALKRVTSTDFISPITFRHFKNLDFSTLYKKNKLQKRKIPPGKFKTLYAP